MGDGEKLLTYLNSALKVLLGLDIFPRVPKKKLNFVVQCYLNLFCHKTLHVSGIFSAHHQEFSTIHLAMVSFMQVFDDRFQAESRWNWKRS